MGSPRSAGPFVPEVIDRRSPIGVDQAKRPAIPLGPELSMRLRVRRTPRPQVEPSGEQLGGHRPEGRHDGSRLRASVACRPRPCGMIARTRTGQGGSTPMQMKLELIPLPVSDVDRAIAFYADKLGFKKDFDVQPSEGVRIVQLTPEGSGCSVGFGTGLMCTRENPAVSEACTWWWRTSPRRVPSLSAEVWRSARSTTSGAASRGRLLRSRRQHARAAGDGVAQGRDVLGAPPLPGGGRVSRRRRPAPPRPANGRRAARPR